jgi:hypothetical protein
MDLFGMDPHGYQRVGFDQFNCFDRFDVRGPLLQQAQ